MLRKILLTFLVFGLLTANTYAQDNAIPLEAEAADTIGSDFRVATDGTVTYVTPSTDLANSTCPGTPNKVLTFKITFAAAGTYDLYVKLRVGAGAWNDDSFYFGSSFGTRPADVASYWVRVNNIGNGAADPNAYVLSPDKNSAGNEIFKWINASETGEGVAGGTLFVISEDSLTQFFQIGSRENGLDIDKIAFGNAALFYTVSNLENGEAGVPVIPETGNMLIVDLSDSLRPVTHCASGSLYGITQTIPSDIDVMVAPLNPYVFCQPARAGSGNQHNNGAGAIPVSARLTSTTAKVQITLADLLPNWPYQWPGQESWLSQVTSFINDKKASGSSNYHGYVIWNERHGTWNSSNGDWYTVCWKPTYDLIRSLDTDSKIIGPGDSYYGRTRISEFLTFCINNNCLPDIMCWHELQGSANISSHIKDYRSLEISLGISELPISINEYCHPTHENEGCPGTSAPFIAKFERNKVESACISWWFTGLPGRLGSLLTGSNQKGGGWWFYKWYGDMTGTMVSVTPPNENTDGIDGFACLDTNKQYASICLGGNYTGPIDVVIKEIPSAFGDSVDVRLQYVPWSSKDTPVSGPVTASETTYTVSAGTITVPVNVTNPLYGYSVSLAPLGKLVAVDAAKNTNPRSFVLNQNYPNPFNPTTNFSFSLPLKSFVTLKIFDMLGREVATIVHEELSSGNYTRQWNASNMSSGIYFSRFQADTYTETKKLILLR
jgi:hypothetical protein